MASRDPKVTPSKSPRTRNLSTKTPPHTARTPAGTPTPNKRAAGGGGAAVDNHNYPKDEENDLPKQVISRYSFMV